MISMWGEEHDEKMADFDKQVELIENKYLSLFNDQVNPITNRRPDKLYNQFISSWAGGRYQIGFRKDTYVPKHIRDEVIEAFVTIFSAK